MIKNHEKSEISEYDFLKLFSAIASIKYELNFIKQEDLEKFLYNYYDNPEYRFLFTDIMKKDSIDDKSLDLNLAFACAYSYGLLTPIKDNDEIISAINLTEKDISKIIRDFEVYETIAVSKLCYNFIIQKKENDINVRKV